jgi:arsenic resistance protein ArsH
MSTLVDELPNVDRAHLRVPRDEDFARAAPSAHPPRILLLYGSLRQRSYSRLLAREGARLLQAMGAETRFFDPAGLPLPDDTSDTHPKVRELRELARWAEGMVWSSPERHGAMSAVMKAQIDWIPLSVGSVRPTQGKTLAVMQVCGGSQSFNAVNQMRVLGRWMRMITIPNQSSVAKAYQEFDDAGRMRPSSYYDRVVDVMEELMKFTLLTRDVASHLVDRYSERKEQGAIQAPAAASSRADDEVARVASFVSTTSAHASCGCSQEPPSNDGNKQACCR